MSHDEFRRRQHDAGRSAAARRDACRASAPKPRQLSPLAQLVAAQHIVPAFSPIVVAGMVRLIEFALIALVGVATYFGYVYPPTATASTGTTSRPRSASRRSR